MLFATGYSAHCRNLTNEWMFSQYGCCWTSVQNNPLSNASLQFSPPFVPLRRNKDIDAANEDFLDGQTFCSFMLIFEILNDG